MQFKLLFVLSLIGCAFGQAVPVLEKRDASVINNVLKNVETSVKQINRVVDSYKGPEDNAAIAASANRLNSVMTTSITQMKNSDKLAMMDLFSIQGPARELIASVSNLIDSLDQQKPVFEKAGIVPTVVKAAEAQKSNAVVLTRTVMQKMPDSLQQYAKPFEDRMADAFTRFFQEYKQ